MAESIGRRIAGGLAYTVGGSLVTGIMNTTRVELVAGHEFEESIVRQGKPAIYVLWHGRLLPCAYRYRGLGMGTLISRNRDGEYITGMIERWGYHVIRGSSSRGGAGAQLAIIRALRDGRPVALTPDGPRGPRQKMKMGPIRAAWKTGAPILPVSAAASAAWYFGRWDRFLVPKPFARISVALGEPVHVGESASEDEMARIANDLEVRLNRLTDLVDEAARARAG